MKSIALKYRRRQTPQQQRGVALMLVLVLLVVTTMMGTTALRTSRIQEQLAGATYDRAVARAAGDAAMVDAHLFTLKPDFEAIAMPDAQAHVFAGTDGWTIDSWRQRNFDWVGGPVRQMGEGRISSALLLHLSSNPTYIIERIPLESAQVGRKETVVRASVRATGARNSTEHYSMAIILLPQ